MLFINALCVVCATINSSKNGCFLRLYRRNETFFLLCQFFGIFLSADAIVVVVAAAVAVYFIFGFSSLFFGIETAECNIHGKQNPRT